MVHCDFHVGNIFIFDEIHLDNIFISDMGLCGDSNTDKMSVYGGYTLRGSQSVKGRTLHSSSGYIILV
jgi:hypothetical protein